VAPAARRRLELALFALGVSALAGYLAVAALRPLNPARNNDVFIHLTSGRLLLEEGRVQRTDRYSFTAPGARYVPHEWGTQALYALAERSAGIPGVIVTARLLPALALLAVLVLAFAVARHRLLARPDLLALALLIACLWLLLRHRRLAREGRRSRAVWWLIPLQLAWVNLHGSFPLGVALTLAFAGDAAINRLPPTRARTAALLLGLVAGGLALLVATSPPPSFAGPAALILGLASLVLLSEAARPWLGRPDGASEAPGPLFLLAGAQGLGLLLNPTGVDLLRFPLEFGDASGQVARSVIGWRPLVETLALPHWATRFAPTGMAAAFLYLAVAFLACAIAWRRRTLTRLPVGLLLGLALLPLRHTRWLALFALGTAPALGLLLSQTATARQQGPATRGGPVVLLVAAGGSLLLCLATLAALKFDWSILLPTATVAVSGVAALWGSQTAPGRRAPLALAAGAACLLLALSLGPGIPEKVGQPWRPGLFLRRVAPLPAIEFLEATSVRGRLCTEYDWAGYAIYALWPEVTVNIDSRSEVYGDAGLRDWILAHRDPEAARERLADCDLALVSRRPLRRTEGPRAPSALLDHLVASPRWHLLYQDSSSALFAIEREGLQLPPTIAQPGTSN
jgi:hypothetical protein